MNELQMEVSYLRYFLRLCHALGHVISRALCHATLGDDQLTNSSNHLFEGISKVKTPAVKAFKATYQGRYTLRDCEGEPLSMTAMETITDLLLEIMEVT